MHVHAVLHVSLMCISDQWHPVRAACTLCCLFRFLPGGHGATCRMSEVDELLQGTPLQINVHCNNIAPEIVASIALIASRCSGKHLA